MTLCCRQVISSSAFKSQQTNKSYTIFHEVSCSSAYVIYLTECTLCKKQYVRKSETSFNIRLNNHCKDVKRPDAILACRCFQEKKHVLNKQAKFIIRDKLTNTIKSKDILCQRLIERFHSVLWKKQSENMTSQQPTKRPREDPEEATPTISVNQAWTATITEESVNRNENSLTAFPITIHNTNGLTLKLNCKKIHQVFLR